jgi:excisionase family DNA binding protein
MERLAYTPREACEALRIGRTKLYQLFASGDIKAVALGGKTLIPRDALEAFLASLPLIGMQRLPDGDAPKNTAKIGGE